ncbi:uncharacterized protein LOC131315233 [Rhododendron vialii]|uniref:uncharacterized protein LOC131315233 n=1 Tax=Rhododendron vialii TaxID=182163 RepID=UPI00265FE1E7|nr:uncharacterized protein LOC131315233 [Rhododendron vialii]
MYTYPLLDKRAGKEMKMQTDGPADRKQLKKLNNQMQVLKLLPQPTLQLIKEMWANASPNNVAYTGAKGFVMVEDIQEILRDGELGHETINAYAELLVEEYDKFPNFSLIESQPKRSYVFSGDLMNSFVLNTTEQNEQMFGELLPDAINSASYLIFPIFCKSHWTLLILDTTRPMWLYYNSLKIEGRDNYFDASTPLRLAITKYICSEIRTSRLENFSSTACMCPTPK